MARNFYLVLGVSRDADPAQIRKAHRRLVRIHHPDTESGSVERFTEIQQAYETLADEEAKRAYDATLNARRVSGSATAHPRRKVRPTREVNRWGSRPESLLREEPRPVRMQDALPGLWSTIDEFVGGWVPGFFTGGRTASRRKDLYVEIILDSDEASRGGLFPLEIPVREPCTACQATGYVGLFLCRECAGRGIVGGKREVEISMPAGVSDGTEARLSLEDVGVKGVDLNVLVSVRPESRVRG